MYAANLSCVANDGATAGENTGQGNKEKRGGQWQVSDWRRGEKNLIVTNHLCIKKLWDEKRHIYIHVSAQLI